jgi:hypothetical protein
MFLVGVGDRNIASNLTELTATSFAISAKVLATYDSSCFCNPG